MGWSWVHLIRTEFVRLRLFRVPASASSWIDEPMRTTQIRALWYTMGEPDYLRAMQVEN